MLVRSSGGLVIASRSRPLLVASTSDPIIFHITWQLMISEGLQGNASPASLWERMLDCIHYKLVVNAT
jgi:hypothetical protein